MAKINFSNYKRTKAEKIPDSQIEVVPAGEIGTVPTASKYELDKRDSSGNIGQSIANVASPVAAICDCVKVGMGTIEVMSKCIAAVSIEREKTKQAKSIYGAKIAESKEQTLQVKIQEKEETKRLKISCVNNLKLQKIELEKLIAKLSAKERGRKLSHEENMACISMLQNAVDGILESKDQLYKIIQNTYGDRESIEKKLHELYVLDEHLVEMSKQIVSLRGQLS